jgi:hypothetical protein
MKPVKATDLAMAKQYRRLSKQNREIVRANAVLYHNAHLVKDYFICPRCAQPIYGRVSTLRRHFDTHRHERMKV